MPTPRPPGDAPAEGTSSSLESQREVPFSNTRPLSRGASRAFVILSILFVLAASFGGAYLLIELAENNAQQEVVPADSAGGPLPDPGQ